MSALIRLPGTATLEVESTTTTVTETVLVCQEEPRIIITVTILEGVPDPIIQTTVDGTRRVCVEQPIVQEESTTKLFFDQGWDSGADSVVSMEGDGAFKFSITEASIAVFCGLNDASLSTDPLEIDYAFYGTLGEYTTFPGGITGAFTDATLFKIQRMGSTITWFVDDVVVHSLLDAKTTTLWADASLYATGDTVLNAAFVSARAIPITGSQLVGELPALSSSGLGRLPDIKGVGIGALPSLVGLATGFSTIVGTGAATLPHLQGISYEGTGGKGAGILPRLISSATGVLSLMGTGAATLPALLSGGFGGFFDVEGMCMGFLPSLIGTATGDCPLFGGSYSTLPHLISLGYEGVGGRGKGMLPALIGAANALPIPIFSYGFASLPRLVSYALASVELIVEGIGDGILPRLKGFATETFAGYGSAILPVLTGQASVRTNTAYFSLGTFTISSYGGTEHWTGYCFYDPIYLALVTGLKGTWLTNAEKRIETYFGLLGSDTRTITVQRNYDNVSGTLAYVATYYQSNIPQRFDLVTDLLDFVRPSKTSAGWDIDRILAHELTHAVMNDRINTLSWPGWFNEGLCEFIHGAARRVYQHLATESIASLLNALNDNLSGHASMTSRHYAAGYLAVWKLHSVTAGGIKTLLLDMATGTSLNTTIANNTPFTSVANFLAWMTGSDGELFVQQLNDRNAFSQADTGAIGGFVVDGGPILDNTAVIPD